MKIKVQSYIVKGQPQQRYIFWCPGCKSNMWFSTPRWKFNGDFDRPTVSPSIQTTIPPRCHLFVKDGALQFLGDSDHEFAGKTVQMRDVA